MLTGTCHCENVSWKFQERPESATACNCTVCRRYGVLWAYGYVDEEIIHSGDTSVYMRGDKEIEFHFCPTCGSVMWWRAAHTGKDGRRRIAVNLRMAEPEGVAGIPVRHFDGLVKFNDLPDRGTRVADLWA